MPALRGRRVPSLRVPFLSVSLSSWWLKLVTRTDFSLARLAHYTGTPAEAIAAAVPLVATTLNSL